MALRPRVTPHRTSSAASFTAQILLDFYDIKVKNPLPAGAPLKLQASEHHIGVWIDLNSNADLVAMNAREPLSHWQTVMSHGFKDAHTERQISYYVGQVVEALETIPRYENEEEAETVMAKMPVTSGMEGKRITLSRAAIQVTTQLLHLYDFCPKEPRASREPRLLRLHLARDVDAGLSIKYALKALPMMRRCRDEMRKGNLTPDQVRAYLRELGVLLTHVPHFGDRYDEVKLLA